MAIKGARTLGLGLALALTGLLSGCGDPAGPVVPTEERQGAVNPAARGSANTVMIAAVSTGESAPAIQARAIEVHRPAPGKLWEVHVVAGEREYEVLVSPDGTSIVDYYPKETRIPNDIFDSQHVSVPLAHALVRALAEAQTGELSHAYLDWTERNPQWVVELETSAGATITRRIPSVPEDGAPAPAPVPSDVRKDS